MDNLVGTAEIAERLNLSHAETVHNWRHRYADFPEPVAKLRQALVWNWPDVEAWARRTGRIV
ncbi:MAG: prophage regulatory protein [Acidimicrobiaceae bacterium]|nr:prophage regulatory protein [Acidimicrobiaceae bacterium]